MCYWVSVISVTSSNNIIGASILSDITGVRAELNVSIPSSNIDDSASTHERPVSGDDKHNMLNSSLGRAAIGCATGAAIGTIAPGIVNAIGCGVGWLINWMSGK